MGSQVERICATESMPRGTNHEIKQNVEQWKQNIDFRDTTAIHIYVAWHIITQNDGMGITVINVFMI